MDGWMDGWIWENYRYFYLKNIENPVCKILTGLFRHNLLYKGLANNIVNTIVLIV